MEEVVSVTESRPHKYSLQTTRSWEFSGLQEKTKFRLKNKQDLLSKSKYGKDVIVGVVDSGNYIFSNFSNFKF